MKYPRYTTTAGITILGMSLADERRRYNVTSSLIGWAHTQNDPCAIYYLMRVYTKVSKFGGHFQQYILFKSV